MSIEVLKKELAGLADQDRSQIMAYLVSLQDSRNDSYLAGLARKIDTPADSSRWIGLDEFDRRLATKKA